jgi:hypothetical protein
MVAKAGSALRSWCHWVLHAVAGLMILAGVLKILSPSQAGFFIRSTLLANEVGLTFAQESIRIAAVAQAIVGGWVWLGGYTRWARALTVAMLICLLALELVALGV